MDPELQLALQNCLRSANELMVLLERDDTDMPDCVGGEILEAYQKGLHDVQQRAEEIRQTLLILQEGM